MKCIIYSRVSTQDQDNQRAIDELTQYAKYKSYDVVGIFQEKITGATKAATRSEFKKLLEFVEKENVDVVLVWELSRLGRSMLDVVTTIEYLASKRINVFSLKEGINTLNEKGEKDTLANLLIGIVSSFSEMERESIKHRSKSGIRASVAKGGAGVGKIKAYGYKSVNKRLEIDTDESEVVKKIFELYINGWGTSRIANYLNSQGIPTKYNKLFGVQAVKLARESKSGNEFKWVDGTIYSILKNTIYIGKRKHRGEIFQIEPIVDEGIFTKAQKFLKEKNNKKDVNRKYRNPLKKRVICGRCKLNYFLHKRHDNSDSAYKCLSKRYGKSCGNVSISIDKLNQSIYIFISHLINRDLENESKVIRDELIQKRSKKEFEIEAYHNEISILNRQENKLLDSFLSDIISKEIFGARNDAIQKKKQDIENKIHEYYNDLGKLNENISNIESIISDILNENISKEKSDILQEASRFYLKKNMDEFHQNSYKENVDIFERTIEKYNLFVNVYCVNNENIELSKYFPNKQDALVLIKLAIINARAPLFFVISQRSNIMVCIAKLDYIDDVNRISEAYGTLHEETDDDIVELINQSSDKLHYSVFAEIKN